jgi:iron complex transport system substrate-binding protein
MVYGSGSLAHDIVVAAGGRNAFADTARALATPGWEEVLERNPDVVVDAGSPPALRSYLRKDPALAGMSVVRSDRFLTLEYEQTVPGPRAVDGVLAIARYLRAK